MQAQAAIFVAPEDQAVEHRGQHDQEQAGDVWSEELELVVVGFRSLLGLLRLRSGRHRTGAIEWRRIQGEVGQKVESVVYNMQFPRQLTLACRRY